MPDNITISYRPPSYPALPESQQLKGIKDYNTWSRKIKSVIGPTGTKLLTSDTRPGVDDNDPLRKQWEMRQEHIMSFISSSLGPFVEDVIPSTADTVKKVWDALELAYNPPSASSLEAVTTKLLHLRLEESPSTEDLDSFTREFNSSFELAKTKGLTLYKGTASWR